MVGIFASGSSYPGLKDQFQSFSEKIIDVAEIIDSIALPTRVRVDSAKKAI